MSDAESDESEASTEVDLPPEVRATIAVHAEEIARSLDNLGEVNDLLDGTAVPTAAKEDEMLQNLITIIRDSAM